MEQFKSINFSVWAEQNVVHVCPWNIPQRQAGVGVYMHIVPDLAGGGVMYKCDMCADLLKKGKNQLVRRLARKVRLNLALMRKSNRKLMRRAKEIGGYVYGDKENSGTLHSMFRMYLFQDINEAIMKKKEEENDTLPGRPHMKPEVENMLETASGYMLAALVAPVAGAAAAGITAYKIMKGENKESSKEEDIVEQEKE